MRPTDLISAFVFVAVLSGCRRDTPSSTSSAVTISHVSRGDQTFVVAEIDPKHVDLQLFWKNANGQRFANFETLKSELHKRHRKLLFATNAGIFDPTFTPLGLHVEDGHVLVPLNRGAGAGNFYLKPNGVFLVNRQGAQIVETEKFSGPTGDAILATQSGPMLVIDGAVNSIFAEDSQNRRIRSGIGVGPAGNVCFAISTAPVTFREFAELFRNSLACRQAFYLDGVISRFYPAPADQPEQLGSFSGILAVTTAE